MQVLSKAKKGAEMARQYGGVGRGVLLSSLEVVPGRKVLRHLGLVQGSSVRAKHVGRDVMASLKNLVGGELKGYTELLRESRDEAIGRMIQEAESIGANAILNIRLGTASITAGAAEVMAYGTAVVLDDEPVNVETSAVAVQNF